MGLYPCMLARCDCSELASSVILSDIINIVALIPWRVVGVFSLYNYGTVGEGRL